MRGTEVPHHIGTQWSQESNGNINCSVTPNLEAEQSAGINLCNTFTLSSEEKGIAHYNGQPSTVFHSSVDVATQGHSVLTSCEGTPKE